MLSDGLTSGFFFAKLVNCLNGLIGNVLARVASAGIRFFGPTFPSSIWSVAEMSRYHLSVRFHVFYYCLAQKLRAAFCTADLVHDSCQIAVCKESEELRFFAVTTRHGTLLTPNLPIYKSQKSIDSGVIPI